MASPDTQRLLQVCMARTSPQYMLVRFLSPKIQPNHVKYISNRIYNSITYNLVQESILKLLSIMIIHQ